MVNRSPIYKKCGCGVIHILDIPKGMEDITISKCGCKIGDMEVIEEYPNIIYDVITSMVSYRRKRGGF